GEVGRGGEFPEASEARRGAEVVGGGGGGQGVYVRLVHDFGGGAGQCDAGGVGDDAGVGELQRAADDVGAAGERTGSAVEVCQTIGQVHDESGAAADVERSIVGEVARGGEVETAGDGKGAIVGGQIRQAIGRAGLVLN